ncbi:TetR/AcrR family transcriptional regulator [Nocardioides sambongensis]|uniref:TetR/AcrR family transcriptional regulator n=1 Tax=Nocardioides sambongensis TaxID=2589074 RepID=UPI001128129F|nr:TetR/AcrR family transcriptional regulator [Nocardioides sambongensis]
MSDTAPAAAGRADATRERLFTAAIEAFAAKGFHGTTTRDIAAAAGMSPAALYVHHRSKEELLHLISQRGHERTLELIRAARASAAEPVGQLRAVAAAFAEHHARAHTTARIINYELAALDDEHAAEIAGLRHRIDVELRDLVGSGVADGTFDCPDPRLAAAALLSLGIDIARWYHEDLAWTPEQIAEAYGTFALRIVGARAD